MVWIRRTLTTVLMRSRLRAHRRSGSTVLRGSRNRATAGQPRFANLGAARRRSRPALCVPKFCPEILSRNSLSGGKDAARRFLSGHTVGWKRMCFPRRVHAMPRPGTSGRHVSRARGARYRASTSQVPAWSVAIFGAEGRAWLGDGGDGGGGGGGGDVLIASKRCGCSSKLALDRVARLRHIARLAQCSSVAQLVEQVTVNHRVGGSSPSRGATRAAAFRVASPLI